MLNTYYTRSAGYWGSVLARELTHVYFYDYTKAGLWNAGLKPYANFVWQALALYAQKVVYAPEAKNYLLPGYTQAYVKAKLKASYAATKKVFSWKDAGMYDIANFNPSSTITRGYWVYAQAYWQSIAVGYFLANGTKFGIYSKLEKLVYHLKYFTTFSSSNYLRSPIFDTALGSFETSFDYSYGKKANADWTLSNGSYKDKSYLYGDFWYKWYN